MDCAYLFYVILSSLMFHSCLGQNNVGFTVQIYPELQDQQFKINETRILTCQATATSDNQKPTLQWFVKGTPAPPERLQERDGSLVLTFKVRDGDEGVYKCVATLGSETDERSVRVEVVQELQTLSPNKQWGIIGQDGKVECKAVARPLPSIAWKFENGTSIKSGEKYVIRPDYLEIKHLTDEDTRKYNCDLFVIKTGQSLSFIIDYQVVTQPKIDIPPTISPNNPKVGDPEVKLTCHATGNPNPQYKFLKNGNEVPKQQVDDVNGILTIHDLKREDEAVYTCIAWNIGGEDRKENKLDVKIPPVIADIADVKDAVEGGQQKFTCTAQGDPAPTVTWEKQGYAQYTDGIRDDGPQIIPVASVDRDDAEIKTAGKIMSFNFIRPEDAGTYICTAINVVGNATKYVKFEVRYKPTFNTDFKDKVFYAWKGHTENVTCQVRANDAPNIQFYEFIDGRASRIENEPPYTLTSQQQWPEYNLYSRSLMIYASEESSPVFKDYLCEASNSFGTANQTVTLQRAAPPGSPIVSNLKPSPNKVTMVIDAPKETGGKPVIGYSYQYFPSKEPSKIVAKDIASTQPPIVVELSDLLPDTSYTIRVLARNIVGLGTPNNIVFNTLQVTKPSKLDITSPSEGSEPTSYTVQWAKPDDGGSDITQIIFKYKKVKVTGSDPLSWKVTGDIDADYSTVFSDNANALSHVLKNLERDTYYEIRVTALNKEGESPEAFKIIKTSAGMGKGSSGAGSLTFNAVSTFLLLLLACLTAVW